MQCFIVVSTTTTLDYMQIRGQFIENLTQKKTGEPLMSEMPSFQSTALF